MPFINNSFTSSSSSSSGFFILLISNIIHTLDPINNDEILPAIKPINTAILNVNIEFKFTINNVMIDINVVIDVHIFLMIVSLDDIFTIFSISFSSSFFLFLYFNFLVFLILSNTTIVSFIEYPIIVSNAATNIKLTSIPKITKNERIIKTCFGKQV